jgi:hypothetical protein
MDYNKPYNVMDELKILKKSLDERKNFQGSQAVQQAMVRIESLTYDVEMYKNALGLK